MYVNTFKISDNNVNESDCCAVLIVTNHPCHVTATFQSVDDQLVKITTIMTITKLNNYIFTYIRTDHS